MECVYNHNGITCACATDGRTECRYADIPRYESGRPVDSDIHRTNLSMPLACECGDECQNLRQNFTRTIAGCRRIIGEEKPRPSPWRLDALPNGLPTEPQFGANPKDRLGAKKIDLGIVPSVGIWHEAAAFFDGGIEYDPFNWRENKVLARVYIAAMRRHIDEWESGIEETSDTGVHHLGAVRACANILLDAQMTGNLIDNRPKSTAFAAVVDKLNAWAKARVAKGRYRNV